MSDVKHVTDSSFDGVLTSETPTLVEFWAPWCGPCRQLSPILDQISDEWSDKLDVVKINIDENPEVTDRYGISSIPALFLFKDGEVKFSSLGAQPKQKIQSGLTPYL